MLSGLLGIGGGILMVPAFSAWVGLPLKETIATSLACVGIFAIPGTLTHWYLGHIDWTFAVALAIGVIPGAQIGARLHDRQRRPDAALHGRHRARHHRGDLRGRRDHRARLLTRHARPREHGVEHRRREPAGERVLLARMERAEDRDPAARHFEAVREPRPTRRELDTGDRDRPQRRPRRLVTERAERDDRRARGRAARTRGRDTACTCRAPPASACWRAARSGPRPRRTRRAARSPSSRATDVGLVREAARGSIDAKRKSPDRSPVKTRPVRFPPCAAGASPTTSTRGVGIAEPGNGPRPSSPRRETTRASRARPVRAMRRDADTRDNV